MAQVGILSEAKVYVLSGLAARQGLNLKFEDKQPSIKLKNGDEITFDGVMATVVREGVQTASGQSIGLRSTIGAGWLVEKNKVETDSSPQEDGEEEPISGSRPAFDLKSGGNFDEYLKHDREVISEDDRVVHTIKQPEPLTDDKKDKLEISPDQALAKTLQPNTEKMIVSSSTVTSKSTPHAKVIQSSDQNLVRTIRDIPKTDNLATPKNKILVTDTTPRLSDEASLDEINRLTEVVNQDDSGDAKVVGKTKQVGPAETEVDGIILKNRTGTSKEVTPDQGARVVKKVGEKLQTKTVSQEPEAKSDLPTTPKKPFNPATKKGLENYMKKEAPAKQPVGGCYELPQDKEGNITSLEKPEPTKKTTTEVTKTSEMSVNVSETVPVNEANKSETPKIETKTSKDYMDILPEDWSKMHWVKAEKFIREQTDIGFLEFIAKVEPRAILQKTLKEHITKLKKDLAKTNG